MDLRDFGTTGLRVSPIALGTVKFGRTAGLKLPKPFRLPSDAEAASLLALAADLGINLIDTAPAYGTSEERLGALLKGQRDKWLICSKAGEEFDAATGQSHYVFSREHITLSVERSLKRLGTDRLDIVLIHSNGDDLDVIDRFGALDTLERLKVQGKIRATGMSTKTIEGGLRALAASDCVMVTHNLAYQDELPVIDAAAASGKGVLIKKPLASGHAVSQSDHPIAESFRVILGHPGVSSLVVGTIDPHHLAQNVEAASRALNP